MPWEFKTQTSPEASSEDSASLGLPLEMSLVAESTRVAGWRHSWESSELTFVQNPVFIKEVI